MTGAPGRVRAGWMAAFAIIWLAVWTVQLTPVQLLLPKQLDTPDDANGWISGVVSTGIVLGVGGLAGVLAGPLAGALSDRTDSRLGRRRPWAIGGAWLAAACLVLTGFAVGPWFVGGAWVGVSVGIAVTSAALTAMIADQLPEDQRGVASSVASAAQAVGIIVGVGTVVLLGLGVFSGYLVLAGLIAVVGTVVPLVMPDPRRATAATPALRGWLGSLRDRGFGRMILGRLVVNIGNALGTALLLYFLMYGLGRGAGAEDDLLIAIVIYTVFVVGASFLAGWWSDRAGNRRALTVWSAMVQAAAALCIAIVPTWEMTLVGAALLGVGYGAFSTTGLAFATDLLPDPDAHARDLGIVNVSASLGQLLGPLIGAGLVAAVGGFWLLFAVAAVLSVVGGLITATAGPSRDANPAISREPRR